MASVAVLIAAPLAFGVAAPAGARSSAPKFVAAAHVHPLTVPNTDIKGKTPKFKPQKLKATWSTSATCDGTSISFSVTNLTKQTQQLTYQGSPVLDPIPPQTESDICVTGGSGKATIVLGLTTSANTLTIHLH